MFIYFFLSTYIYIYIYGDGDDLSSTRLGLFLPWLKWVKMGLQKRDFFGKGQQGNINMHACKQNSSLLNYLHLHLFVYISICLIDKTVALLESFVKAILVHDKPLVGHM